MPSERFSRRRWIRVACFSAHAPLSLLALLAVLVSCPVACASHPSPDALAATRGVMVRVWVGLKSASSTRAATARARGVQTAPLSTSCRTS